MQATTQGDRRDPKLASCVHTQGGEACEGRGALKGGRGREERSSQKGGWGNLLVV